MAFIPERDLTLWVPYYWAIIINHWTKTIKFKPRRRKCIQQFLHNTLNKRQKNCKEAIDTEEHFS